MRGEKRGHYNKTLDSQLHKAGNCILEAPEFSIFLGCYLPLAPLNQGLATPLISYYIPHLNIHS